ncbi:hypothetical protein [Phaffia rhodozyma]|uniref:Uncharacterized protein n=1 Tax=Phaffia rhodozyma TaxID=264483 RepID=A0A0F7SPS5_PHARH|nr:hypothetical protein [Phaffia rhodozyma]
MSALLRTAARRAPVPSVSQIGLRSLHFENVATKPKTFQFLLLGTCGFWFALPFIVSQYQLRKTNKHLGWYDPEEL